MALDWVDEFLGYVADGMLPKMDDDKCAKLRALIEAVPEDKHMVHGDYHIKNVMVQNGESLLIDMDTLSHGHPIFELAAMYNAYRGFGISDHGVIERFLGISYDQAGELWYKMLHLYLGTDDEAAVRAVEDKAALVGLMRITRRAVGLGHLETESGRKMIETCYARIIELLEQVDSLLF